MTSIKYAHLQVMGTITGKFNQNLLKTVGGVAETRLCLRPDRLTDGRTVGRTQNYSPLRLTSGDNDLSMKRISTFAIWCSKMAPSAVTKISTEHEIDNISITAEWILITFVSK